MGDIIDLPVITTLDMDPDKVINNALGECPGGVVIIGYNGEGELTFASSLASSPEVLWMLEMTKKALTST